MCLIMVSITDINTLSNVSKNDLIIMLRLELIELLQQMDLKLLDIEQRIYNHKVSTKLVISGWSKSYNSYRIKEFLIQSIKIETITNVIKRNWS